MYARANCCFSLDKRPFQADLDKAVGQMKRDQAQAENSRIQSERYSDLEKDGIVSHEQADQLRAQAKADASAVEADKAAVDAARVQLQYTDIVAPINARAGALDDQSGQSGEGERHALSGPIEPGHADLCDLFGAGSKPGPGAAALHFRAAQSSGLPQGTIGQSGRGPVDVHRQWSRHDDRHV